MCVPSRRCCLAGLVSVLGAPLIARPPRRNLVFILSDDHRYDMMGCRGHPWLKTPALDRLAREGALFENAFVTTALCSPSRASILTGRYVHSHGVTDNITPLARGMSTFPEVLQRNGYRTGFIGKWHMGGESDEPRAGFDHWISFRGQGRYYDPILNVNGVRRQAAGYVTDLLTDEALRFIRENSGRPFFLYLSHKAVHAEFAPAARHKDLYQEAPVPHPASMANSEETYRGKPDWVRRQRNSWHGVDGMYDHRLGSFDEFYRSYCRTLAALDESVGRMMEELERLGLANDTLVMYMGDNGFLLGEHGLIDKRAMYEPSIRVPMIARCPDLFPGGLRPAGMALNLDIGPTFLEAADVAVPAGMQGRSLLGLIRGTPGWRTEFLYEYFWERDYPQTPTVLGLRTEQYSYMHYHGIWDLDELYDIGKDPGQRNNLLGGVRLTTESGRLDERIQDPELRKLVADLQGRMQRILSETGGRAEPTWSEPGGGRAGRIRFREFSALGG